VLNGAISLLDGSIPASKLAAGVLVLGGDVTGPIGSTTVAHVSDSALSTNVTLQGNTFNIAGKLVKLDGSGNVVLPGSLGVDGPITMTGATHHTALTLANDGDLNVTGNTILGSSHWDGLTVNAHATFNNGLTGNLTGNATTATTATDFTGSLVGDVTGTQGATVVSHVSDSALSSNIPRLDSTLNTFTGNLTVDGNVAVGGNAVIGGVLGLGKQTLTIADNGNGSVAVATLTPTSSYVEINCLDVNGCNVNMGTAGVAEGTVVVILNDGTNGHGVTIQDGASHGTNLSTDWLTLFPAGQSDTLTLLYHTGGGTGNVWVELARSNN
jgi:hypothetical protein